MNWLGTLSVVNEALQTEARRGPGTVFLVIDKGILTATRAPDPQRPEDIIAKFDAQQLNAGLNGSQWFTLMRKVEKACQPGS